MKLRGRKPIWRDRILELLEKKDGLTQSDLEKELGCPKSSLSQNIQNAIEAGVIELGVNAQKKPVYVLSPSEVQKRLRKSIALALESISLRPLETVATSYGTVSGREYTVESSVMEAINFILQKQQGHKISEIFKQYEKTERLQLFKIFANVILDGLRYCLREGIVSSASVFENQIRVNPKRTFQIVSRNFDLFLEYGLRKAAPSFVQKKSHLRILALELKKILSKEYLSAKHIARQMAETIELSQLNQTLLAGFLDKFGQTKFMLVVPFGFPELEEANLRSAAENLQSFNLWMQRLKAGPFDQKYAKASSFLFVYGTRNLKRIIKVFSKNPAFMKSSDSDFKTKQLKRLLLPKRESLSEIGAELRFAVDLREPWDFPFLYERHPRGHQPEFYSEIYSLVKKRRDEAKEFFTIPTKEKKIRKLIMTRKGFLVYYEGQERPELIGPYDHAKEARSR